MLLTFNIFNVFAISIDGIISLAILILRIPYMLLLVKMSLLSGLIYIEHTAFLNMKRAMTSDPVLQRPYCSRDAEFVISTDASKFGIGGVLLQADKNNNQKPCAYFAKSLNKSQQSYSTSLSLCTMETQS